MKLSYVSLFLVCFLLISSSIFQVTMAATSGGFCDKRCEGRCSKAGVKDRCLKYCGICCEKCKCVPSGTFGRKHECACYRDLKNSKGKSKCP